MRIQHNISALNTHRNLAFNNAQASKNLEKLSSGYKINRAGDDAAGLAISEKMRGQIRGLDMATKNSQDAISLIQTAEGALNETHAILQRMRELSVQSGNDTNVNTDRDAIQQEIEQLTKEIDRIAETTEFNTQSLLDGSFAGKFQIGANENQDMGMDIGSMSAATLGLTKSVVAETGVDAKGLKDGAYKIDGTKLLDAKGNEVGKVEDNKITLADGDTEITFANIDNLTDGATINVKGGQADLRMQNAVLTDGTAVADEFTAGTYTIKGTSVMDSTGAKIGTVDLENSKIVKDGGGAEEIAFTDAASLADGAKFEVTAGETAVKSFSNGFPNVAAGKYEISGTNVLKDGVKVGEFDTDKVTIKTNGGKDSVSFKAVELGLKGAFSDTAAVGTGVKEFTIGGVDVSTREQATGTITAVDSAIKKVSEQRSQLGAVQNRLEHTINNLGAASENLTAAESRIRDTDMAKEMMEFTKNNILMQAAQSMLAQANQQPQGVLQLLG